MNIIVPSTGMMSLPKIDSPLETECLFGETVEIIKKLQDWIYCKLLTDNYLGWVRKDTLGNLDKTTHRVNVVRTFIFESNNEKSKCNNYLPMGAQLPIIDYDQKWAKVNLSDKNEYKVGYIPNSHIIQKNDKIKDWVAKAEDLINTPYKWGGRDTLGIDCSALLQLSYQTYGQNIPRNTADQININKNEIYDINKVERGFAIFWNGHVGIMTDEINCIHANAFHMKTTVEPLEIINKRIGKKEKILKIFNLNEI